VILLDSIPGLAFANMANMDASVKQPDGLTKDYDPSLYLFNPKNGWNSNQDQSSNYSPQFTNRYTQAQGDRENDLVNGALQLQRQIASGNAAFTDDFPFPWGHDSGNIFTQDDNLLSQTQGAYPLIMPSAPNGAVMQIYTVRVPAAAGSLNSTPQTNDSWDANKFAYSVSTFLSNSAIWAPAYRLTDNSIEGVDWASSNTATVSNVGGIHAPMLIMSGTAHYWMVPSEMYYLAATKSSSRTLAYVYGATHDTTPCTLCTSMPYGPYGNTEQETFNYMANWLQAHF
jgi:hypothetical protein